jgi:hypothetical protein
MGAFNTKVSQNQLDITQVETVRRLSNLYERSSSCLGLTAEACSSPRSPLPLLLPALAEKIGQNLVS